MGSVALFGRTTLNNTTRSWTASIPLGVGEVTAYLNVSEHTDPATGWTASVDISLNSGTTWQFWYGCGRRAGAPGGTESTVTRAIPEPSNPNRRARLTITTIGRVVLSGGVRWL